MFLVSSIEKIHLQMMNSAACFSAASAVASSEVMSNAPSVLRKAPKTICVRLHSQFMLPHNEAQFYSVSQFGKEIGFDGGDKLSVRP
jgi:hypothetical protein